MNELPVAGAAVPLPEKRTGYPAPFAPAVAGRTKRKLGDFFGVASFGINLTHLSPGAVSSLLHHHSRQDEFVYVLEGTPTLMLGDRELQMGPGDCVGLRAGTGVAHQLVNRSEGMVAFLEIGDRAADDQVEYPNDDLALVRTAGGEPRFTDKSGNPY